MKIVEFFSCDNKEHWIFEMEKCDWGAGKWLSQLLKNNELQKFVGEGALVPMLTDGDKLVSFCTFAPLDEIQPTNLSPWIGFVYTFPEYRGMRCAGKVLDWSECVATIMEEDAVYISTDHVGLYESYGYDFLEIVKHDDEDCRVYVKKLQEEDLDKDGCFECDETVGCPKGFYSNVKDGNAAKAKALFIKKYGKEALFKVYDNFHKKYDFEKTQEILGYENDGGLKILEDNM